MITELQLHIAWIYIWQSVFDVNFKILVVLKTIPTENCIPMKIQLSFGLPSYFSCIVWNHAALC